MYVDVALTNVLVTLMYIVPGYLICKAQKATADHLPTLSAILVYICSPCMIVNSFLDLDFSWQIAGELWLFFVVSLLGQCIFMAGCWVLLHKKYEDAKYRILTIGSVLGNVGFFGLPIIRALLPQHPEVTCYSSAFMLSMNILVFTMGVYCLTNRVEYVSMKHALVNPTGFAIVIGFALFASSARGWMPIVVKNSIGIVGSMTTPLCMMILGIRLAVIPLKRLFQRPIVYAVCIGKLLVFPLFCYGMVLLLPVSEAFRSSVLVLCGTPCAAIILSMAEMHRSEQELAANCVLLSTLMCFLTIPLLTLLA